MINNVETTKLRVNSIIPSKLSQNISTNTKVRITFNSDLNTSTIVNNISVLKDNELKYVDGDKLVNDGAYEIVKGNVSYDKDSRTIIFIPNEQFDRSARYIISVRENAIQDILGNTMVEPFISTFFTESVSELPPVNIITPKHGTISNKFPIIEWELQENSDAYIIEISKEKTYEVLEFSKVIKAEDDNEIENKIDLSNLDFDDGLYYIRIRSINGIWSEDVQFFIKKTINSGAVVTEEDLPDEIEFESMEEEFVILDYFPKENDLLVSEKINIIYVKILGKVDIKDIDVWESFVEGVLFDEEDDDVIIEHGYLNGTWSTVFDEEECVTYVIFTPNQLGEV